MYKIKAGMYDTTFTDRRSTEGAASSEPTLQQQFTDQVQKLQADYDTLYSIERKKAKDFEAKYAAEVTNVQSTQKLMIAELEKKTMDVVRAESACTPGSRHLSPGCRAVELSRLRRGAVEPVVEALPVEPCRACRG